MDTKFWGKDGWKFLHSIVYSYDETNSPYYKKFFNSLQYILPCIYCRRSFKKYIKEDQVDTTDKRSLTSWLYRIHNRVNEKLRKQGYNIEPDPTLEEVDKKYEKKIKCQIGFNFIHCIMFHYNFDVSERRKKGYIDFFESLSFILPKDLSYTLKKYLEKYPLSSCFDMCFEKNSLSYLRRWSHRLEMIIKNKNCKTYKECCDKIEKYRVEKCRGETCRK